jgi:hypothetical protein
MLTGCVHGGWAKQVRLGILDDPTAPALDVSWRKVKRTVADGKAKATEAATFISRAVKLLGSDTFYALGLIGRAFQVREACHTYRGIVARERRSRASGLITTHHRHST